jgi:hypothetical protein
MKTCCSLDVIVLEWCELMWILNFVRKISPFPLLLDNDEEGVDALIRGSSGWGSIVVVGEAGKRHRNKMTETRL